MNTSATPLPCQRPLPAARGVSIIELMVGLVIGLLVSLAAVSSASLFTAAQRQGVGVGTAGANTAAALSAIKDDVANGGLGFFGNQAYLCQTLNASVNAAVVSDNAAFAPVRITRVGSNDQLDVVYGNDVSAGAAVKLSSASNGSSATLKNYLPAADTQAVLLAPTDTSQPCLLRSLTATPAPPTALVKETLVFGNAGRHNQAVFTVNPSYPENSLVTMIGTAQWNRYALNGAELQMTRVFDGTTVTLMRNVIGLRFEYGVSASAVSGLANGNRAALADWVDPTEAGWGTVTSANIGRIKAVRIGLVVRSPQREKENAVTGQCEASTAKPVLFGNEIEPDVTDWQCYRYRTQIVVAPLRNIIYGM